MEDIILIGGGGHCKSCIEIIESTGDFNITGILDMKENVGKTVCGYPIINTDDAIEEYQSDHQFLITVGHINSAKIRKTIYNKVKSVNGKLATIISPRAYVSKRSKIGEGTIIMNDVIINAHCKIGVNNIINNKALLEHDVEIADHNHISTNATINGTVLIGCNNMIGSSSTLINNISIANEIIIGAGATVVKNINKEGTYMGIPAKRKN